MQFKYLLAAAFMAVSSMATAATTDFIGSELSSTATLAGTLSGNAGTGYTDSVSGSRLSPWEGTAFMGAAYTSLWSGGSELFTFGTAQSALKVLWGSPDSYNYITFTLSNGDTETVSGSSVTQGYTLITTATTFTSATFWSTGTAFEYAAVQGVPAPVPLPAAGLLLVGAVAGLGAVARRRRA